MPAEVNPNPTAIIFDEWWRNIATDAGRAPSTVITDETTAYHLLEHILFGINDGVYGDGADGYVTFDGTSTVLGIAPSNSTYTLTRDIQCAGITVATGVTIIEAGFIIRCNGILTLAGTANINNNGNAGTNAGAAGAAVAAAVVGGGTAGGAGSVNNGSNGAAGPTSAIGGSGGAGGAGGTGTAGAAATVTAPAAARGSVHTLNAATTGVLVGGNTDVLISGGAGGGGGGGDGTNTGGGGGGGAGICVVIAKAIQGTGTITATGGAGGAGASTGNTGGGGGGGGGGLYVVSRSVIPRQINKQSAAYFTGFTGTATAAGGAGGALHGTGAAGTAGAAGTVLLLAA